MVSVDEVIIYIVVNDKRNVSAHKELLRAIAAAEKIMAADIKLRSKVRIDELQLR